MQKRDERRAWVPNYDLFFFEVESRPSATLPSTLLGAGRTGSGIKMLHGMRAGEMGSLVVSTPVLPRYKIGDLILAFRPPYFRCIGRDQWWAPLRYGWDELTTLNLAACRRDTPRDWSRGFSRIKGVNFRQNRLKPGFRNASPTNC